jgi:hypothetical protein
LTLNWYFLGAESGDANTLLSGPGNIINFTEDDENNNTLGFVIFADLFYTGPSFIGSYIQGSAGLVDMRFSAGVSNDGQVNSDPGIIFAYVTGSLATGWTFSSTPTDQVAFGLNDNTSTGDDNHDDWMGVVQAVPVPAAVWLLAPAIAGLAGFAVRRRAAA